MRFFHVFCCPQFVFVCSANVMAEAQSWLHCLACSGEGKRGGAIAENPHGKRSAEWNSTHIVAKRTGICHGINKQNRKKTTRKKWQQIKNRWKLNFSSSVSPARGATMRAAHILILIVICVGVDSLIRFAIPTAPAHKLLIGIYPSESIHSQCHTVIILELHPFMWNAHSLLLFRQSIRNDKNRKNYHEKYYLHFSNFVRRMRPICSFLRPWLELTVWIETGWKGVTKR